MIVRGGGCAGGVTPNQPQTTQNARVDDLLPDRVVAAGVVVGGVLLAVDDLLGVVQVLVGAGADWRVAATERRPHNTWW
jgi:hypothetical protein